MIFPNIYPSFNFFFMENQSNRIQIFMNEIILIISCLLGCWMKHQDRFSYNHARQYDDIKRGQ